MTATYEIAPLHPIGSADKLSLEAAIDLTFPCSGLRIGGHWGPRKITDLLIFVGPNTLLRPPVAIKLAYPNGPLDERRIQRALWDREIAHYKIDDKKFVTLADLDGLVSPQSVGAKLGSIYFVGFKDRVKIGFTLGSIAKRIKGLQTACPVKIELYASLCGTPACERALHRRFCGARVSGEWFKKTSALSAFIARIQATEWRRGL